MRLKEINAGRGKKFAFLQVELEKAHTKTLACLNSSSLKKTIESLNGNLLSQQSRPVANLSDPLSTSRSSTCELVDINSSSSNQTTINLSNDLSSDISSDEEKPLNIQRPTSPFEKEAFQAKQAKQRALLQATDEKRWQLPEQRQTLTAKQEALPEIIEEKVRIESPVYTEEQIVAYAKLEEMNEDDSEESTSPEPYFG